MKFSVWIVKRANNLNGLNKPFLLQRYLKIILKFGIYAVEKSFTMHPNTLLVFKYLHNQMNIQTIRASALVSMIILCGWMEQKLLVIYPYKADI